MREKIIKLNVLNLRDLKTKYITATYNKKKYKFCCFGLIIDNELVFECAICDKKITKIIYPNSLYKRFVYELVIKQWFMDNKGCSLNDTSNIKFEK